VRAAEHAEAGQCDIIVVTAGAAQKKGQSSSILAYASERSVLLQPASEPEKPPSR
jgi:L-lactate dehydrogenase